MSILRLNSAVRATVVALGELETAASRVMPKIQRMSEVIASQKEERAGEVFGGLFANIWTQAVIEAYVLIVREDPDHPDLNNAEAHIQRFGGTEAVTLVRQLRAMVRRAVRARRARGDRAKSTSAEDFRDILTELTGGTFP